MSLKDVPKRIPKFIPYFEHYSLPKILKQIKTNVRFSLFWDKFIYNLHSLIKKTEHLQNHST